MRRATLYVVLSLRGDFLFLSTLSLRRATVNRQGDKFLRSHFYPRSPCGERQPGARHANSQQEFLSTLSLRRATLVKSDQQRSPRNFYPRSPCGERPLLCNANCSCRSISIHALLAESDANANLPSHCRDDNFYPRSPCGERPEKQVSL